MLYPSFGKRFVNSVSCSLFDTLANGLVTLAASQPHATTQIGVKVYLGLEISQILNCLCRCNKIQVFKYF